MKKYKTILFWLLALSVLVVGGAYLKRKYYDPSHRIENARTEVRRMTTFEDLRDGDIIFQTSLSRQSKAIQLATHSRYSHCGIIFLEDGKYVVYEAVQPVKRTPLDVWIARGEGGDFEIKRLRNADTVLTPSKIASMKKVCTSFLGKSYDGTFEWSDDKFYCSELVWKVYHRALGVEVSPLQRLRAFDLTHDDVKKVMKERYGNNIPLDEAVVAPSSLLASDKLVSVSTH